MRSCARTTRGLRRMGREWPGALLARRTRTVKLCAFDARSKGQPWPLPSREVKRIGGPSLGLMARLGVTAGGRVRKLRAVEDQSAPIPEETTNELGRIIYIVLRAHSRINQTDQTNQIDQIDQINQSTSPLSRASRSKKPSPQGKGTPLFHRKRRGFRSNERRSGFPHSLPSPHHV